MVLFNIFRIYFEHNESLMLHFSSTNRPKWRLLYLQHLTLKELYRVCELSILFFVKSYFQMQYNSLLLFYYYVM